MLPQTQDQSNYATERVRCECCHTLKALYQAQVDECIETVRGIEAQLAEAQQLAAIHEQAATEAEQAYSALAVFTAEQAQKLAQADFTITQQGVALRAHIARNDQLSKANKDIADHYAASLADRARLEAELADLSRQHKDLADQLQIARGRVVELEAQKGGE